MTEQEIKRNVLRAMGINLSDEELDTVHDVKLDGDKLTYKVKLKTNFKDWRFAYGSCADA
jgi:hypothetical protein